MNLGTATEQKCPQNAIFNIHEFLWSDALYVTKDLLFSTSLSKGFLQQRILFQCSDKYIECNNLQCNWEAIGHFLRAQILIVKYLTRCIDLPKIKLLTSVYT